MPAAVARMPAAVFDGLPPELAHKILALGSIRAMAGVCTLWKALVTPIRTYSVAGEAQSNELAALIEEGTFEFPIGDATALRIELIQRPFYESFISSCAIIQAMRGLESLQVGIGYASHGAGNEREAGAALTKALSGLDRLTRLALVGRGSSGLLASIDSALATMPQLKHLRIINADVSLPAHPHAFPSLDSLDIQAVNSQQLSLVFQLLSSSPTLDYLHLRILDENDRPLTVGQSDIDAAILPVVRVLDSFAFSDRLGPSTTLDLAGSLEKMSQLTELELDSLSYSSFDWLAAPTLEHLTLHQITLAKLVSLAASLRKGLRTLSITSDLTEDRVTDAGESQTEEQAKAAVVSVAKALGIELHWL